jgi:PAS domain S-box-containing protein
MPTPESPDATQVIADLTLRLQAAEQQLEAREATLLSLGQDRGGGSKFHAAQVVRKENAELQQMVAQKTLEMEAQDRRLKLSEQGFSGAFEHAPIGVCLVSLEGRWLRVNPAFCDLVGYSEAELMARTYQDITHPDDFGVDAEIVDTLLAGERRMFQIEKRYLHAKGHVVPISLNVSLARDGHGEPLHFIAHVQDITSRREAEEKHRVEEVRNLRQRAALIALTKFPTGDDSDATIRRLTETCARTLGVARVSVWRYNPDRSGLRCVDLYELEADRHTSGIELPAVAYPIYFEALKGMDVIAAEDAHRDSRTAEFSENYLRPLNISSMLDAPIHLAGIAEGVLCHEHIGQARSWTTDEETFAVAVANRVSLALEASERQRVADELRRTLAQLEQMLAHSPAVIFRLKVMGSFLAPITTSDNIQALLGYTAAETYTPEWWSDHVHPDDLEGAYASMMELLRNGSIRHECRIRHKDGRYRWIEDNQRLLRDSSGDPIETVGVWMDITDRKEAEAKLESIHRELMEVSRQAGMAEVATSVLHNVGNVLNSVNISSSVVAGKVARSRIGSVGKVAALLREHQDDLAGFFSRDPAAAKLPDFLTNLATRLSEDQAEVLQELRLLDKNIGHIKVIVSTQQDYAKLSDITEMVEITELVEDSLQLNGDSLTRHGIKVVREFSEVPAARVQRHKVLQILVNLIRNAKHACDESGRPDKCIIIRATHSDGHIQVAVIDNGIGIPHENITRIFGHGYTTRAEGHGFGLHSGALAAKELGGALKVHSDGSGAGATFILELPVCPPSSSS